MIPMHQVPAKTRSLPFDLQAGLHLEYIIYSKYRVYTTKPPYTRELVKMTYRIRLHAVISGRFEQGPVRANPTAARNKE